MPNRKGAPIQGLSKRAREVLDTLFRLKQASVGDVLEAVDDLPSYSAARSVLRGLYQQGLVLREERDFRYVYRPALPRGKVSRSALAHVLETFFDGSPELTMKALVDLSRERKHDVDWVELEKLVRQARREGK